MKLFELAKDVDKKAQREAEKLQKRQAAYALIKQIHAVTDSEQLDRFVQAAAQFKDTDVYVPVMNALRQKQRELT